MFIDARIPVRFCETLPEAPPGDAALIVAQGQAPPAGGWAAAGWAAVCVLAEEAPPAYPPVHPANCRCCGPRPPQAAALTRLFHQRARGETGYFRELVACLPAMRADALRAALEEDMFLACYFKQQHRATDTAGDQTKANV